MIISPTPRITINVSIIFQTPKGSLINYFNDMSQLQLAEGEKKIDKYIVYLKQCLGKGSFAEVFMGRCIATGEQVAVKVIDKKLFSSRYNIKSIQNEIEILKKVEHKNVVRFMDVYQTQNNMYIFTEFCMDGDLQHYLKKRGRLSEKEAVKILKELVQGYQYLLSIGILHRDLKPANILVSGGVCKISDFGLAKTLDVPKDIVMNSLVGTPLYMSPQILKKGKYTSKSDLWSIGLIFYQLLHGCLPWTSMTEEMLLNNIMTKPVLVDKSISQRSRDFIKNCLRISEQERISWDNVFKHSLLMMDNKENYYCETGPPTPTKQQQRRSSSRSPISKRERPSLSRTPTRRYQDYSNGYK